jgi:CRP-like cAMP-binding protein
MQSNSDQITSEFLRQTQRSDANSVTNAPALLPSKDFKRRSILPHQPYTLWRIEVGIIKAITWLEDGTVVTLGLWGAGSLVGSPICRVEPYHLECLTDVTVIPLPSESWKINQEALLDHLQQYEEFLILRSYRRVDEALLQLLSWLAKRFGRTVDNGQLIELRLTHQDIADLLGTTRVTVTRLLGQFEEQQVIKRLAKHVTLYQLNMK